MSTKEERETLFSIPEAAEKTGVPERTLRYAATQGHVKSKKISGRLYVTIAAVKQWKEDERLHRPGPK